MRQVPGMLAAIVWSLGVAPLLARADSDMQRYVEHAFNVTDGLPQSSVNAIAQTPDGYLWIGTDGGLARFDGRHFVVWRSEDTPALRIHKISALMVDHAGDLWITTDGGAGIVRHRNGKFNTFETQAQMKGNGFASAMQTRSGDYWFGTWWGALSFSGGVFEKHNLIDGVPVSRVLEDTDGSLWMGSASGLLHHVDGRTERYDATNSLTSLAVAGLEFDAAGVLWVGTRGAGMFVRGGSGKTFHPAPVAGNHKVENINALLRDRDGTIWGGSDHGLFRVERGIVVPFTEGHLADAIVRALFQDRDGQLWVGTKGSGLSRLRKGAFVAYPGAYFSGNTVVSVLGTKDGSVWFGTDGAGLVRSKDGIRSTFTEKDGLCTNWIWALAEDDDGMLWVGGQSGPRAELCKLDPRVGSVEEFGADRGLPKKGIHAISPSGTGQAWVGTVDGFYQVTAEGIALQSTPTMEATLAEMAKSGSKKAWFSVHAIHEDRRGDLWLAAQPGLHRRHNGQWSVLGSADGLSNGAVFSIEEDAKGNLWIGSLNGFSRVTVVSDDDGRVQVTSWRGGRGFRDGPVYKVIPDRRGDLWLCSPDGVYRITKSAILSHDQNPLLPLAYSRFGKGDGLQTDTCEGSKGQSGGWIGPDDNVWFSSGHAAVRLAREVSDKSVESPRAVIESATVDGEFRDYAPTMQFAPGRGDLRFGFTAVALYRPEFTRFRYRLEPFDSEWVQADDRREAHYTNIPSGHYRFLVSAGDLEVPWQNKVDTTLYFFIAPHFHERWSVRVLSALVFVALLFLLVVMLHRRRIRAVEARHKMVLDERLRISRDLHDTLGQGFTGIAVQLEAVVQRLGPGSENARDNLDRARALVRSSLADARRAVWDLQSGESTDNGLVARLSVMARGMSANVPIRVQINGKPCVLPKAHEENLTRIGQEAMTNAIRHARATAVSLEISFLNHAVELKIVDNGVGFDGGDREGHLGMSNLRQRAQEISAGLSVKSEPGQGTTISVLAPTP